MLNPIEVSEKIKDEFVSYLSTYFHIADENYAKQFVDKLNEKGVIAKGPYLDITDSFEVGENIETLISKGEMSPLFRELEKNISEKDKEIKLERNLYSHQEKAVLRANKNKNLVITTGTGSGKTECFILPIINHLFREKEKSMLNSGVRAILIYPMNALANDQMKRLRLILKDYPDITFGVYNSGTKEEDSQGIAEYHRIFKDANGIPIDPLPNEKISRKSMRENPPHILVTNYAMLEYMLLRPNDDKVFSNSKLKFLVLDEAHIYRGAKGIETSLLLRRLKARIADSNDIIHILTSATLGGKESDGDIVTFANTLGDADFNAEDIIRSKTVAPVFSSDIKNYPLTLFAELANPKEKMNVILDKYNVDYDENLSEKEILYNLCLSASIYKELRKAVSEPMTVSQIANRMKNNIDIDEEDIVNLISVASKAEKGKTALIKARYHMFVRALEGAYITLGDFDMAGLTLTRDKYTKDGRRIFEAAVCDDCGRIGIAGKINGKNNVGELVFANDRWDSDIEIFLLKNDNDEWYEEEGDEESADKNDYIVCAKCGKIAHESILQQNVSLCDCDAKYMVKVRKAKAKNEIKCPCCHSGKMKTFYVGYDAATAVLGTELFEQLPEKEAKLEMQIVENDASDNIFAAAVTNPNAADIVNKKRQFLSFSDSRSEAAFFACYMTNFYKEFLRRRGIWHIINDNKESMDKNPWDIVALVQKLTAFFDSNTSFAEPGANTANLTPISEAQAWIAVLNEMVKARRSTSLVSLGVINFVYKGNTENVMKGIAKEYEKDIKDVTALFNLLVMDIVYNGAIEGKEKNGNVITSISNDDREYIYFTASKRRFVKQKGENDKEKSYLHGWLPRQRKNETYYSNNRVIRTMKVLGIDDEVEAIKLLSDYWEYVLMRGEFKLESDDNGYYYIGTDKFEVRAGTENTPIYICDKCKRPTMINCQDRCVSVNCDGKLKRISHEELLKNNHYAKLYAADNMKPLYIKEHTAQLGKSEQQKYQEMFVKKEINALSCSTTFEMGVDVGDLETVYLRNVPPSPANYTQRAGRAGRSLDSAAYVLTYAKLSSHDFTYFANPERMILGKMDAPMFNIENKKVVYRHIFAVALSDFFSLHKEVYNGNNADVLLNGEGYELLVEYLNKRPEGLRDILKRSIPKELHKTMGIDDFSWTEKLIGDDEGALKIAVDDFKDTIALYEKEIKSLLKKGEIREAGKYQENLKFYRRNKDDGRGKNELIEFLVRNNILPKYGFPIDTVELYPNINWMQGSGVNMVRDLQMAIAEYAPDAEVVADGKLYTSRYIRKLPAKTGQAWEEAYIAECKECQTWNYSRTEPTIEGKKCISCDEVIEKIRWKKAIEPRKGFIAEFKPKDVHLKKPEHSYKSDDYYIGDKERQVMSKKTFLVNGEHKIQMETSTNDSLMVVCKDSFQVCSVCGYSTVYNVEKKKGKEEHLNPWGKKCKGSKSIYKLCHAFKTDVVQLVFDSLNSDDRDTMLSVLYALLEGASYSLDIERSDIKGCLHRVKNGRDRIYSVILYDAVAGGAGHVRRLAKDDGETLKKVIKKAIDITKNCNCDPSCYNCLRNYYNQAVHDNLDRKKAYDFLKTFNGNVAVDNDEVDL